MTSTTTPTTPGTGPTGTGATGRAPVPDRGDLLRYALAAAARGWPVFPLTPGDKVPLRGWHWTRDHSTDPAVIRQWWRYRPHNIGIATGPAGLLVIDLDTPKTPNDHPGRQGGGSRWALPGVRDGADVLTALADQAGQRVPWDTFTVRTRRGGLHLYLTAPARAGIRLGNTSGERGGGLGPLIDTRGEGGYVVGPGSHVDLPDGTGTYDVIHPGSAAPLPDWLTALLTPTPLPPQRPVTVRLAPPTGRPADPIDGAEDRARRYLQAALDRTLAAVLDAPAGTRNRALYGAAVSLGQLVAGGALDVETATGALVAAGTAVGQTERAAAATVRSGLRAGANRPRTLTTTTTDPTGTTETTGAAA